MTKKDYIAIAEAVKRSLPSRANTPGRVAIQITLNTCADYFSVDNPRFDREKFLKACGF